MNNGKWLGLIILVAIAAVLISPLLLLWGLSFIGFPIEYTVGTWFGAFLIQMFIGIIVSANAKKKND